MATSFANGTLTTSRAMTVAQAQRLIDGVLGAENIPTTKADGTPLTNAEKRAAFDDWLWRYLKNDAKSWETRQAAATAAATAESELP